MYHTGMYPTIKFIVGQVPHHIQRPSHLLDPFILTLGKTFPDLLHCVDQDYVAVENILEIHSCRDLPEDYLPIHLHHQKVVPLGVIPDRIISPIFMKYKILVIATPSYQTVP